MRTRTDADSPRVVEDSALGALAAVAADDVDTLAVGASVQAQFMALVDVLAHVGDGVELRAARTDALEAARRVAALTAVADQVVHGALVDVRARLARAVHLVEPTIRSIPEELPSALLRGLYVRPRTKYLFEDIR